MGPISSLALDSSPAPIETPADHIGLSINLSSLCHGCFGAAGRGAAGGTGGLSLSPVTMSALLPPPRLWLMKELGDAYLHRQRASCRQRARGRETHPGQHGDGSALLHWPSHPDSPGLCCRYHLDARPCAGLRATPCLPVMPQGLDATLGHCPTWNWLRKPVNSWPLGFPCGSSHVPAGVQADGEKLINVKTPLFPTYPAKSQAGCQNSLIFRVDL